MRKHLFGSMIAATFILLAVLGSTPAHAAAPSPLPVPNPAASSGSAATCPAPTAAAAVPDFMNPPAVRLGYCHCGCSSVRTCRTSADCGGASCDQVISCC